MARTAWGWGPGHPSVGVGQTADAGMDGGRYRRRMTEPIAPPTYTPPVVGPPIPRRRKRWPWVAAAALLAAVLVTTGFLVFDDGKLTVHGTVTIGDGLTAALNPNTATCDAHAVAEGDPVVITASNGDTLALGHLGSPKRVKGGLVGECQWSFSVSGVTPGRGPYSVEVGNSGKVVFTDASKPLDLSISGS